LDGWYGHKLLIERPSPAETRWWIDLLLLDTVVREWVDSGPDSIGPWRFHRRAADDKTGHKFELLHYGTAQARDRTAHFVSEHEVVATLLAAGLIRDLFAHDYGAGIDAASAPDWPESLARAWPSYIRGASESILQLVDELRDSEPPVVGDGFVGEAEAYYSGIMADLTQVWRDWGSHAYFHHLNGLFGYQPLIARPRHVDGALAIF
jgi:hypothetical protein